MISEPEPWISFDAFLTIEEEAGRKHEYDDGYLTAMAGATARHVTITQNLVGILRPHLRGTACRVYSVDMKLRPERTKGYYPDVFVSCDERNRAEEIVKQYPSLVIEVLSRRTERRDRGTKWAGYRLCETLQEYVLVSQYSPAVEVYCRSGEMWAYRAYGTGERVPLASIDLELSMGSIYEDIEWGRKPGGGMDGS